MILLKEYDSLNDVLIHLKLQVLDSIPYASEHVPHFTHPSDLFYWLKDRLIYENDPHSIELLMTMQTLFTGSRTGRAGAGDCDDFTITGLACLSVCGMLENSIVLTGHNKETPVHIYIQTIHEGVSYWFDLTNEKFDFQRTNYKYQQILKFSI